MESKLFRNSSFSISFSSLVNINNSSTNSSEISTVGADTHFYRPVLWRSDFDSEDPDLSSLIKAGPPRITADCHYTGVAVAQLVRQLTIDHRVSGTIPAPGYLSKCSWVTQLKFLPVDEVSTLHGSHRQWCVSMCVNG
ncbi:hypothetical protein EXN66_Car021118 [Channa argus]|uniref:Uncharacterized protein n=1 Tax=Channa argus TaxID=215402 RepID=A0A6G1QSH3_CHAAH|nr:hypothetical protein EXN66_Car021118 [Channa argus]